MWSRIVILFSSTPIVLGEDFQHYMEVFFPFLKLALQNYAAYQVPTIHNGRSIYPFSACLK